MDPNSSASPNTLQQTKVADMIVQDQNSALNIMVNFLNVAQKRGTFTLEESAKIWECIKLFSGAK